MERLRYLVPILAIMAAIASFAGLLPLTFGMAGIATPLFPGSALFFLIMLGGPLLLLASGLNAMAATKLSKQRFLISFTALLIIAGLACFWRVPALLFGWVTLSIVTAVIAEMLKHDWLWAAVGGIWTGALLGLASLQTAIGFLSPDYRGTPGWWWPLWLLGCILALATAVVAFIRRRDYARV
jgi:hypothetical protein